MSSPLSNFIYFDESQIGINAMNIIDFHFEYSHGSKKLVFQCIDDRVVIIRNEEEIKNFKNGLKPGG